MVMEHHEDRASNMHGFYKTSSNKLDLFSLTAAVADGIWNPNTFFL